MTWMRIRAIWCSLWFGILPWWLYERKCHYRPMSYWAHLVMNLGYAWVWITGQEDAVDIAFERRVNGH